MEHSPPSGPDILPVTQDIRQLSSSYTECLFIVFWKSL